MRSWRVTMGMVTMGMAASCAEPSAASEEGARADAEAAAETLCAKRASCTGGNDLDRAACAAAEVNGFELAQSLGCSAEAVDYVECIAARGSCSGSLLVADGCGPAEQALVQCEAAADRETPPGAEVDDAYVAYCEQKLACMGGNTLARCSYALQGGTRVAQAYGCEEEHDAHFACLAAEAECDNGSFDSGICQDELTARTECISAVSAFD